MPAAMVFPTAAAMPNHMPRTWSRRPRPAAGEEFTREEGSDVADNVRSRGIREMQPSYPGDEKMQAGIGGEKELSVISLPEELKKICLVGAPLASLKMQSGVAELLTAASVERIQNPTPDAPSMSILECRRSSICPRRKIRAPVENESGQFS